MFMYVGYTRLTAVKYNVSNEGENLIIICNSHTQKLPISININSWSKYFDNHKKIQQPERHSISASYSELNFATARATKT